MPCGRGGRPISPDESRGSATRRLRPRWKAVSALKPRLFIELSCLNQVVVAHSASGVRFRPRTRQKTSCNREDPRVTVRQLLRRPRISDCRLYVFPSSIRTAPRGDVRVRERGSVLENLPSGAAAIGGATIRVIDSETFFDRDENPGGENPGDR